MPSPRLTDAQRAERRVADRERMQQAARRLLDSEGWQRWVRIRATNGLARYSFHNQLLIALQRPDATYVAGFQAFLELGRCVRKGEKAIGELGRATSRSCRHVERGHQRGCQLLEALSGSRLGKPALEGLDVAEYDRQRIVEIVRYSAGETADSVHLLGLMQLLFQPRALELLLLLPG